MTNQTPNALTSILELGRVLKIEDFYLTGSTYFFGKGKDDDLLVLIEGDLVEAVTLLKKDLAYTYDYSEAYPDAGEDGWVSLRKGRVNLLLYNDKEKFDCMMIGAKLCRFLAKKGLITLDDKPLRIAIHEIISGKRDPEDLQ